MAQLEFTALAIERTPLASRSAAAHIRFQALELARAKPAGLRELQLWVVRPGPFAYTDLAQRLASALRTLVNGQWYDLPGAEVPPEVPKKLLRWMFGFASVLVLGAIVLLILFPPRLGLVAPMAIGVLGIAFIALLNAAGLPTVRLREYVEIGGGLFKGGK